MTLTDEEVKALWNFLKSQWLDFQDHPMMSILVRKIMDRVEELEDDGDGL